MVLFITGIGTDVGKSFATGWLASRMMAEGKSVITQKFIQTGNTGFSEDITVHRRLMQTGELPEDEQGLTAPEIFSYPASPDLAARIDGRPLDLARIDRARYVLEERYEVVLVEGAGGIMVPLEGPYLTIDYIRDRKLPVVLVTNGKLGSVSDTLLSLFAIKQYGLRLHSVIYNPFFDSDKTIALDSRQYMQRYVKEMFPEAEWLEMPSQPAAALFF